MSFEKKNNHTISKNDVFAVAGKILSVMAALLAWQLLATHIHQKILLVTPVDVIKRLTTIHEVPDFMRLVWFSASHIMGGFFIGLALGIILAVVSYCFHWVEILLWPWMAMIKSVPVASFVVICLIWLKSDNLSVFISFLIVVPVIYKNVLMGLKNKDDKMEEAARVFKVSLLKKIRYVYVPAVAPFLISACEISAGMAWKAGVAAEIIGTPAGSVGHMIYLSKMYLDTDDLLAWTVIIVLLSVIFEKLVVAVAKCILESN